MHSICLFEIGRSLKGRMGEVFVVACLAAGLLACDGGLSIPEIRDLHDQRRHAATLEPLRELLEARPNDPEVNYLYGVALVETGDPSLATWVFRKAAEDPKWMVPATLELATFALRAGKHSESIEGLSRVLDVETTHRLARYLRGEAYLREGKEPGLALEDFEKLLELDPKNVAALTSRAAALLLTGRIDEAEQAIEALSATSGADGSNEASRARLCATRAVLKSERDEVEAAEALFVECLEFYADQAVVVNSATAFFDEKGERVRSTAILEKALDLVPDSQAFRSALASRAIARGDLEAAEAILKAGVELEDPHAQATAWTALTNHYLLVRDDVSAAAGAYEHALDLSENPPPLAILTFADLLARDGQHERALEVAKRLENGAYRGLIEARVHLNEGRPAQALARLDEVLPSWPNNSGARYYAARAAEQLGDFARAIEEYRQSIRSGPEQTEAALRLAKLYLASGATQMAWSSASQYFNAHPSDPEGVRILLRSAAQAETEALATLFKRLRPTPLWSVAVATRADTAAEARGAEAALALLEETKAIDLTLPRNGEILRSWVVHLLAVGRTDEARAAIEAALGAHPEHAAFHEIQGVLLEAEAAPIDSIRAVYTRALEIEPKLVRAIESLARLAEAEGFVDEALRLYDRATAAYPQWPSAAARAARLTRNMGRQQEAERRFLELLREHPWDGAAALALAQLRLARGAADATTLELGERAILFGAGEEASQVLIKIHEARGESERASEIARAVETGEPISPKSATPVEPN